LAQHDYSLLVFLNGKHTHSFWEIHSLRQPKSILLAWSSIWLIIVQKHPLKLQVSEETPFLDGSKKFHIKKTRSLVGGDVTPEKTNGSKWQLLYTFVRWLTRLTMKFGNFCGTSFSACWGH
jgi:hypothetical protein